MKMRDRVEKMIEKKKNLEIQEQANQILLKICILTQKRKMNDFKVHWIIDGIAEIDAKSKTEAEKIVQEGLENYVKNLTF